jgi:hypothetical protein
MFGAVSASYACTYPRLCHSSYLRLDTLLSKHENALPNAFLLFCRVHQLLRGVLALSRTTPALFKQILPTCKDAEYNEDT